MNLSELYHQSPDIYQAIKHSICIVGMIIAALAWTACTSSFGAIGGADIQKIYNERVRIESAQELRKGVR